MKTLEKGLKEALFSSGTILGEGLEILQVFSYKAEIKGRKVCRWRFQKHSKKKGFLL